MKSVKRGTYKGQACYYAQGGSKYVYEKSDKEDRKRAQQLAKSEALLMSHIPELKGGCCACPLMQSLMIPEPEIKGGKISALQDLMPPPFYEAPKIRKGRRGDLAYYQIEGGSMFPYMPHDAPMRKLAKQMAQAEHMLGRHHRIQGGFVGKLIDKAKGEFKKFKENPIGYFGNYNYCGPYTDLSKDRPAKNATDAVCKVHDYDYNDIQKARKEGKLDDKGTKEAVRKADQKMLDSLKQVKDKGLKDKVVELAIKAKTKAEDIGLLKPKQFVGGRKRRQMTQIVL